jgi:hypothetical protein
MPELEPAPKGKLSKLQPMNTTVQPAKVGNQKLQLLKAPEKGFSKKMKPLGGMVRMLSEDYEAPSVIATASSDEEDACWDEETRSRKADGSKLKSVKGGGSKLKSVKGGGGGKLQALGSRDLANIKMLSEDYEAPSVTTYASSDDEGGDEGDDEARTGRTKVSKAGHSKLQELDGSTRLRLLSEDYECPSISRVPSDDGTAPEARTWHAHHAPSLHLARGTPSPSGPL